MFEYHHFTPTFLKSLRKEQPAVVKEAKEDHDLERIPSSRQYRTRLERRIQHKGLDKDAEYDWKLDAGEYAHRIWHWWKPMKDKYPFHGLAIRLIVLAQLSSCSVERVFSALERIRKVTGENIKSDMMEICLMLQCNGPLDELYNDLVVNWNGA